jgi:hypothetical protein
MWHRLPKGAAYSLQLPTEHALMVCNNALGALLVLATHDTPTQYHLDLHAASSWLQQQPGGTCRSQLHDLLTSFSELLELWRSSDDEDAASTAADDTTSSSEKASVGSSGVQDDPAAGYLCWPSKQLPAMHTTGTATSSGSGSSMAPAACSTGGNALGNAAARLQVLAVAAAALVHHIKLRSNVRGAGGPIEDAYGAIQAKEALNQLLVLLTQQLLCMAPQLRAAFLHSPAGSILLYVLEVISGGAGTGMSTASGLVTPRTHTAATQQQQQQQTDVTAEWDIHMLDGPDMVEKLLLPALLLHPAQSKPDAAAAPAAQSKCCGQEGMGGCTSRNAAMLDGTNCPLKGSTSSSGGTAATSIATITTSSNAATDTMTLAASCPNQRVALRMLGGGSAPAAAANQGIGLVKQEVADCWAQKIVVGSVCPSPTSEHSVAPCVHSNKDQQRSNPGIPKCHVCVICLCTQHPSSQHHDISFFSFCTSSCVQEHCCLWHWYRMAPCSCSPAATHLLRPSSWWSSC